MIKKHQSLITYYLIIENGLEQSCKRLDKHLSGLLFLSQTSLTDSLICLSLRIAAFAAVCGPLGLPDMVTAFLSNKNELFHILLEITNRILGGSVGAGVQSLESLCMEPLPLQSTCSKCLDVTPSVAEKMCERKYDNEHEAACKVIPADSV